MTGAPADLRAGCAEAGSVPNNSAGRRGPIILIAYFRAGKGILCRQKCLAQPSQYSFRVETKHQRDVAAGREKAAALRDKQPERVWIIPKGK
jgi:hypothetical protein